MQVRPDHLLLRVVARALVLWDSVQPTQEWLQAQLPPLVRVRAGTCIPDVDVVQSAASVLP